MKKIVLSNLQMLFVFVLTLSAQQIPQDSLYLGQIPPGNTPKIFSLPVNSGSFAAERIAISNDSKEIYFTTIHGYYPTTGDTIKYYIYTVNGWTGPCNLFNDFLAPGLSVTEDTMYLQNNAIPYQTFYSARIGKNWTYPQRILLGLNSAHYLQATNNNNYYISSISAPTIGASDWCRMKFERTDTSVSSLNSPISTTGDNLDFYISRDESFLITTHPQPAGLCISYPKDDGGWTNPKSLGPNINFGLAMWGPYVTSDKKYMFYTTGTKADYSDTYVYWVRVDSLFESLKHTNFAPYLKYKIPDQTDSVGFEFKYTFPDTTFIDDDGTNTLTYSATLNNGSPLPTWLSFDSSTRTFFGTPTTLRNYFIKVFATDTSKTKAFATFTLKIKNPVTEIIDDQQSLKDFKLYQNYLNPFNPSTNIEFFIPAIGRYKLCLYNLLGQQLDVVFDQEYSSGHYSVKFNADHLSSGAYLYRLIGDKAAITQKMIVLH